MAIKKNPNLKDNKNKSLTGSFIHDKVLVRLKALGWVSTTGLLSLCAKQIDTAQFGEQTIIAYLGKDATGTLALKAIDHVSKENNFKSCDVSIASVDDDLLLDAAVKLFSKKVNDICAQLDAPELAAA